MNSILVTGSNRGLGLEWVRQYAAEDWRVYATCRYPAEADDLKRLAEQYPNVSVHRLDVTSHEDLYALRSELKDQGVDILLNNAGTYLEKAELSLGHINYEDWAKTMQVNTMGAVRVTEGLVGQLTRGSKRLVVVTSSHMGSITDIASAGSYYYRSSKAALNAAAISLSLELKPRKIGLLIVHPGAVRTRMGGPESILNPDESVTAMRGLLDRFTLSQSGLFLRYDGSEIPW
jgi:NAD(P)-dependent dehydrogenase (short-subunit alcohol dehydrogenase family)